MHRRLPWFPIVPRNAPPDDLRSYLDLYSREAVAMREVTGPSHAEWDVNLPIPKMRELRGLERSFSMGVFGAIGEALGSDPALRFPTPGVAVVSALWAQRALNAAYAERGLATRVATDGISGSQTLNALRALHALWIAEQPRPLSTSPRVVAAPAIVDRRHVSMAGDLYGALTTLSQVADPTPSSPASDPALDPAPSAGASSGVVLAVALGLGAAMWFGRRR